MKKSRIPRRVRGFIFQKGSTANETEREITIHANYRDYLKSEFGDDVHNSHAGCHDSVHSEIPFLLD
jgi:hypothetical protein